MEFRNKPSFTELITVLIIVSISMFMLFLAYDTYKQGNEVAATFYVCVAASAFMIIVGAEAKSELEYKEPETVDSKDDSVLESEPINKPDPVQPAYHPAIRYQKPHTKGYVYLVKALHDETLFKIGRTNNPNKRMRTFEVKLPFAIECECLIPTDDMYKLEGELHRKFKPQRLDGEFFRLTSEDVQYIKSLGATK